ncbi:PIN domain-containing protein [Cupriavidus sp. UME77]|uniref:PIN domain-containing protein n=1 Tax=Cupriavidus sp. UME77 TaxID=1862321 RepID=UPI0015FEF635|nr:PIN domain-containing protein [Cupriavidus sp. UME77]
MTSNKKSKEVEPVSEERKRELEAKIRNGEIFAITFDTSNFYSNGKSLAGPLFKQLEQFKGEGSLRLFVSSVVLAEMKQDLVDVHTSRLEKLNGLQKLAKQYLADHVDLDELATGLGSLPMAQDWAQDEIDEFMEATGAMELGTEDVDLEKILSRYFSAEPPFASNGDKKAEFPDAIALESLEALVAKQGAGMLVVSKDADWARFCEAAPSKDLHHVETMATALDIVNAAQEGRREGTQKLIRRLGEYLNTDAFQVRVLAEFTREVQGRGRVKASYPANVEVMAEIMREHANHAHFGSELFVLRQDPKEVIVVLELSVHCTFHAMFTFYAAHTDIPQAQTKSQRGVLVRTSVFATIKTEGIDIEVRVDDDDLVVDFDPVPLPSMTTN